MKKVIQRPAVGVGVVIRKGDLFLMHKRRGEHGNGLWSLPGGHLEMWESFSECVIRETQEECGPQLKMSQPKLWTVENTFFPTQDKHYVVVLMVADWKKGKPRVMEPQKCDCWHWFAWYDLKDNELMPAISQARRSGFNPFWDVFH